MIGRAATCEEVSRAFLLANIMKGSPNDPDGYRAMLAREMEWLARMNPVELISQVKNGDRRRRYQRGTWFLGIVDLDRCSVWRKMGDTPQRPRPWATGPVPRVAERFLYRPDHLEQLPPIREIMPLIITDLPLVVIRDHADPTRLRLDDGNHRAVTYYLAGLRTAPAYIGCVPEPLNLDWAWEGEPM